MATYLSVSNFLDRSDILTVSKLCYRGTPNANPQVPVRMPTQSELATNSVLAAALLDASAEVLGACIQGDRYTDSDLSGLSGNPQAILYKLVAERATCLLWDRRDMGVGDVPRPEYYQRSQQDVERLRRGERMF